jgi:hypothetical protein
MPPAAADNWPQPIDLVALGLLFALAILLPALGYVFMVLDYRAYLRSLRRFLVRSLHWSGDEPEWARRFRTPQCLAALGLTLPCTEEQVLAAYRHLVKEHHPDHGGDERRFLVLQRYFEQAIAFVRTDPENGSPAGTH